MIEGVIFHFSLLIGRWLVRLGINHDFCLHIHFGFILGFGDEAGVGDMEDFWSLSRTYGYGNTYAAAA